MSQEIAIWLNPILIVVVAFFIKRWMDGITASMKVYSEQQRQCQLSLATTFRTKADAKDDSDKQWKKIDDHGDRLARVETLLEQDGGR